MLIGPRHGALAALLLVSLASPLAGQQNPWDAPAFTADPKALLAAAQRAGTQDFGRILLLDDAHYVIDAEGGTRSRERVMLYVVSEAGVEGSGEVRAPWQPWHHEKPSIEARVITRDGSVHPIDPAAIVEVPAGEETDIFSDGRVLRVPLPAVATGSVVEYVITRQSRNPIPGAGNSILYYFGGYLPVERTRVTLDAPLSVQPHIVNKTGLTPRVEEQNGRRRTVYESGRIDGVREVDGYVPYDVSTSRYLAFSTGQSWQTIATSYSAIVDRQIAGSDLEKLVRAAIGNATDRGEVVSRLLATIQKDVRYAGVEIGEGSIVPRMPRQVLANKYGDCKDKAALLVAMLRVAGFPAHVALLNAGNGFDVQPDLPGMAHFNHAIVVVEGDPRIWVDPTDVFARAGELPLLDQGRMALIASPDTTTLVATPETASSAHVYRELRTFILPEDGKARVTETTEPSGNSEADLRRWVAGSEGKKLRDDLESYAKSAYVAKTLASHRTTDANDLSKPFRMTLEVPESQSGVVSNGEASVVINLASLPQTVPGALRNWSEPQPGDNPEDAPKKRTHDFLFPQPGVREWVYRIQPPAGYVPRTLPLSETTKLGHSTFTQKVHAEAGNAVVATFRFDSGKRRLTPAEFEEARVSLTKFVTSNTVTIGFEQAGQAKLNAGDIRGALDEFRKLKVLHPKEAQHHIETARALLVGGLGDAAREEIRRAIVVEPRKARAHQWLGTILLNDSLGRPFRKGFDLKGAIAAFRKAKELDPTDYFTRVSLATALSYGEDGYRFSRGARLEEAVVEILALAKDLGDEGTPMLPELTLLYMHMGRFADLRALAPTLDDVQQRALASIISTAAIDGTTAAVRELGAFDQQKKRTYAGGVAQALMQVRLYPEAAALMDVATQGTAAAAEQRQLIDTLKKLKRVEDTPADDGPRGVVSTLFTALLHHDLELMKKIVPAKYAEGEKEALEELAAMDLRPPDQMPPAVFGDLLATLIEVQQDGDDTGYRLRMRTRGAPAEQESSLFVRRENGRWMLRGGTEAETLTGDSVLDMAAKGELETARNWLNWAREDTKAGSSDDPLEGKPFAALWARSKATATIDEIRLAAASLATDKFSWAQSEPILLAARERAETAQARAAIDLALVEIYEGREAWVQMLEVTSRIAAAHPDSGTAFSRHVDALLRNGKSSEVTVLATQRLERLRNDPEAVRALASSAATAGDYTTAQQHAMRIVDELRPKTADFARAAWIALFTGKQLERALEHAQYAVKDKSKEKDEKKVAPAHALAALYAETGRSVEARAALLDGLDHSSRSILKNEDWYILGRIAENYGVDEYARAAYGKVGKEPGSATVTELARRRLDGLLKNKK